MSVENKSIPVAPKVTNETLNALSVQLNELIKAHEELQPKFKIMKHHVDEAIGQWIKQQTPKPDTDGPFTTGKKISEKKNARKK